MKNINKTAKFERHNLNLLRMKSMALNAFIRKEDLPEINNISFISKDPKKRRAK